MLRNYSQSLIVTLFLILSGTAPLLAGETVTVVVKDYKFQPDDLTVKVGTTVRWENRESRQYHSVRFEALGDPEGDYFFPGEHRERTFTQPGAYDYICEPHFESHNMKGVVHVVE